VVDVARILIDVFKSLARAAVSSSEQEARRRTSTRPKPSRTTKTPKTTRASRPKTTRTTTRPPAHGYAGDATGAVVPRYEPFDDDQADPGEIVWAWVPFEEDHSQGKDRPVLVIGRRRGLLLALILSSQDHDLDAADEARHGRHWVEIGTGPWDRQGRASEVRVDRVLQLDPAAVRRLGSTLDRARFDRVVAGVQRFRK
jgi:hypothetical protein